MRICYCFWLLFAANIAPNKMQLVYFGRTLLKLALLFVHFLRYQETPSSNRTGASPCQNDTGTGGLRHGRQWFWHRYIDWHFFLDFFFYSSSDPVFIVHTSNQLNSPEFLVTKSTLKLLLDNTNLHFLPFNIYVDRNGMIVWVLYELMDWVETTHTVFLNLKVWE